MKKILCILLACLFLFSILSGCGAKDSDKPAEDSASTEPKAEEKKAEEKKAEETKAEENVEIYYFSWRAVAGKHPDQMIEAFQKKFPNIKVNFDVNSTSVEQYLNSQKVKFLSGDNIDVTSIRPESRADYVKAGYLLDITDQPFMKSFNPSMVESVKVNGKVYGIPSAVNLIGVYYNKDIFSKQGLSEPKNWDEFLAICEKLKAAGITPMMNGGKDGWPMEFDVYPFIHNVLVKNPDIFQKIDSGEIKYTDPVWVDAFKKID